MSHNPNRLPHNTTLLVLSLAIVAAGCSNERWPTEANIRSQKTNVGSTRFYVSEDTITRYIVRLKDAPSDVTTRANVLISPQGGKISHIFERVFQGFVAQNLNSAAAKQIAANPLVDFVEEEGFSYPTDMQTLTLESQWGLDWIDHRSPPLDNQYSFTFSGVGIHIYIVDSGVRGGHVDFAGRMGNGTCEVSWSSGCSPTIDQIGHGTSVASQAAGTSAGVAKSATIHSVRIDDGGVSCIRFRRHVV